jgi:hypothetical protein
MPIMLTLKQKKILVTMLLALFGLGYFSAMSSLEINFFLKSYVLVVPAQAGAIIYLLYLRLKER